MIEQDCAVIDFVGFDVLSKEKKNSRYFVENHVGAN